MNIVMAVTMGNENYVTMLTCNSGKALPIPSASKIGKPTLAAVTNGSKEFIPPISAHTNPVIRLSYKNNNTNN